MEEEYFVEFELEDDITVDESDLSGYTNYERTILILTDMMMMRKFVSYIKVRKVLESISTTEAGELEIAFVHESMIKKMTIDDERKAAESSK